MTETIDYYSYWNKNRKDRKLWDREKVALRLISKTLKPGESFLDAGCGNGYFLECVSRIFPNRKVSGLDFSKSEVSEARKKGLNVRQCNLEKGIPAKAGSCNVLYAGEVLEHFYNPDFFLDEANRVLKHGGFLIFSTPNLCAWFNRVLMPLGIQPLFLEPSTKSKLVGAGFLKRFKKESQPVGHVRIFTIAALKDMLSASGFKVIAVKGSLFDEGLPKSALWLDRIFSLVPSLSSNLVVLAKKK